ncbi:MULTISPECIES: S-layer homology domain-containing protein [unclassified Sporosarcina]|uniref:S-layer homology domain-containing protein n=1 Tax=unclassified Sporosarcina TaxID=2647733 RepID=UPI00203F0F56|nr:MULTISPECIES: S-layer homology domain-containing protein [unclassified Sporosarcina]GKV66238.1 hypothetical protein NCCP2331_23910 [Sporosarcina sp. NCCP-2331]GLB56274.1 hypothetical protein NCCP2378_20610 [Sporosarcina sp. NCCP-2378]
MKKNSYKLFKAALATTVATGTLVAVVPTNADAAEVFKDVKPGIHYYEPVLELSSRGVVKGYDDGTYRPNASVTRGQASKILAMVLGLDTTNVKDPGFKDVSKANGYYGAIAALAEAGFIKGYDDKTFKPNDNLKRSQMAKILALGFELEEQGLTDNRFKDIKKSDAYAGYVQALLTNNITTGTTATTFSPNGLVTRGQMATFVVRTEQAVAKTETEVVQVNTSITKLNSDTVETAAGEFKISSELKTVLNPNNQNVLADAVIVGVAKDGVLTEIKSVQIKANGTAEQPLVLDGGNGILSSNINVGGSFIELKSLTLNGDITIGNNPVENAMSSRLLVSKETVPARIQGVVLGDGFEIKGEAIIYSGVSDLTINVTIPKLTITSSVEIKGTGTISSLEITSKDAKVKLDPKMTVQTLTLPAGTAAKDIIENFDAVKGNIGKIEGEITKPTPPSAGDNGNGGSTALPGNSILNSAIADQVNSLPTVNGLAVAISGNIVNVVFDQSKDVRVNDVSGVAENVFNVFKTGTTIDQADVAITTNGNYTPIASASNVNTNQDFSTLWNNALAKAGVSGNTRLSVLAGNSISVHVSGKINNNAFNDTYTFVFSNLN